MKIQYSKSSDTHFYKIVKDKNEIKKVRISKEEYDKKTIMKGGIKYSENGKNMSVYDII